MAQSTPALLKSIRNHNDLFHRFRTQHIEEVNALFLAIIDKVLAMNDDELLWSDTNQIICGFSTDVWHAWYLLTMDLIRDQKDRHLIKSLRFSLNTYGYNPETDPERTKKVGIIIPKELHLSPESVHFTNYADETAEYIIQHLAEHSKSYTLAYDKEHTKKTKNSFPVFRLNIE